MDPVIASYQLEMRMGWVWVWFCSDTSQPKFLRLDPNPNPCASLVLSLPKDILSALGNDNDYPGTVN